MDNRNSNRIINDDLNINNRSTRMPVIICMEILDTATMRNFDIAYRRIESYILNHEELKYEVQLAKIFFGAESFVEQELSDMDKQSENDESNRPEYSSSPVLGDCLIDAIKQIKIMECKQSAIGLSNHKPNIILFASGNYKNDETMLLAMSKVKKIKRANEISIIPFVSTYSDNFEKGQKVFNEISTVGQAFKFDEYGDADISGVFDVLCKSMERMSASSNNAYESLIAASPVEIEDFKK
ncbi:MAG: hypothetical protein J1E36_05740 [Eubacterium sp.]|nr:hypothetical protein [Eubacterium sp.]